ncbi:hypothetical protein L596_014225 [Steinernema carpocapsae]|uniref:GRIP domain-containing protein n=1 Tax=Steinernema carpocapsae TaxID=34508 RepID=A0A4U5NB93_STECR|nr:hypothetical protein L596_014225 [Steinernema carpocapsae]
MFSSTEFSDVSIDEQTSTASNGCAETEAQKIFSLKIRIKELEEKANRLESEKAEKEEFQKEQNARYERQIKDLENDREEMYLVMFKKGQQAAHHDISEDKFIEQLTEDRIALRFLHDAFYCYLLKKGDSREHLQRIMHMLDFSPQQVDDVAKALSKKSKS